MAGSCSTIATLMAVRPTLSDACLLAQWKAGHLVSAQLTVAERERLNLLVLRDAIREAKAKRVVPQAATDAA